MQNTPFILIDEQKMKVNIAKMIYISTKNGVLLRPHTKTHKIPQLAKQQIEAGASGITVAKVSEAEVMANHGIRDIFIAYPIVITEKIERVIHLAKKINIIVGVDSLYGARKLSQLANENNIPLSVRLEIDTGFQRSGVLYAEAITLAKEINKLPNLHLRGIYTYRGSFMNGKATLDRRSAGWEEGMLMVALAENLRNVGISIQDVSVGSSPTAEYAAEIEGITEVRPGTYIFNDAMQTKLGCCSEEECAAVVNVSIISMPSPNLLIVDGGSKTFATDVQPNHAPLNLKGYGTILGYPEAIFERLSEEHGMIRIEGEHALQIGDQISIIPNHICSTINLHNNLYLKKKDNSLLSMEILGRGKLD